MLLFTNYLGIRIIIPLNHVYEIKASGKTITIDYDGGEITYLDNEGSAVAPKVETIKINFESEDELDKIMRQFYKACNNKAGAFFFG